MTVGRCSVVARGGGASPFAKLQILTTHKNTLFCAGNMAKINHRITTYINIHSLQKTHLKTAV